MASPALEVTRQETLDAGDPDAKRDALDLLQGIAKKGVSLIAKYSAEVAKYLQRNKLNVPGGGFILNPTSVAMYYGLRDIPRLGELLGKYFPDAASLAAVAKKLKRLGTALTIFSIGRNAMEGKWVEVVKDILGWIIRAAIGLAVTASGILAGAPLMLVAVTTLCTAALSKLASLGIDWAVEQFNLTKEKVGPTLDLAMKTLSEGSNPNSKKPQDELRGAGDLLQWWNALIGSELGEHRIIMKPNSVGKRRRSKSKGRRTSLQSPFALLFRPNGPEPDLHDADEKLLQRFASNAPSVPWKGVPSAEPGKGPTDDALEDDLNRIGESLSVQFDLLSEEDWTFIPDSTPEGEIATIVWDAVRTSFNSNLKEVSAYYSMKAPWKSVFEAAKTKEGISCLVESASVDLGPFRASLGGRCER